MPEEPWDPRWRGTPLVGDEKVVTCSRPYMRRLMRLWVFEPWPWYAQEDELLPGECGKIGNARLVRKGEEAVDAD